MPATASYTVASRCPSSSNAELEPSLSDPEELELSVSVSEDCDSSLLSPEDPIVYVLLSLGLIVGGSWSCSAQPVFMLFL